TLFCGRPDTAMATCCVVVCDCVERYTSQRSAVTLAVQFIGSMHACARYGASNTRSNVLGPLAYAASKSPSLRAATPGFDARSAYCFVMSADDSVASGPSSHV